MHRQAKRNECADVRALVLRTFQEEQHQPVNQWETFLVRDLEGKCVAAQGAGLFRINYSDGTEEAHQGELSIQQFLAADTTRQVSLGRCSVNGFLWELNGALVYASNGITSRCSFGLPLETEWELNHDNVESPGSCVQAGTKIIFTENVEGINSVEVTAPPNRALFLLGLVALTDAQMGCNDILA